MTRIVLLGVAGLAVLLPFGGRSVPSAPKESLPNLLLITIDTLRADHLGCYGYRSIQTPVIDALAAEGVLYENCIAQSPMTLKPTTILGWPTSKREWRPKGSGKLKKLAS